MFLGENAVLLRGRFGLQRFEPVCGRFPDRVAAQPLPHSRGRNKQPMVSVSSLATRTWPKAGFSKAISTTPSPRVLRPGSCGQGLRRLISREASSAALLVQLFEAIETVSRVAHHLTGLRDAAQHLTVASAPRRVFDDLFVGSSSDILRALVALELNQNVRSSLSYYR